VLTGDVHSNWVNDVRATPDGPTVATELVGTSLTSGGDGQDFPRQIEAVLSDNPFVRFYNEQRGYVVCDVTPARLQGGERAES
jgi:alkaline phosphatase D